ncbi:MAG TPA: I78 family peptidase inhibitor [Burkholderiaceae bacterium]|nr:I78 family peptidase inhibitor [Burkholderiaceae bacterium]
MPLRLVLIALATTFATGCAPLVTATAPEPRLPDARCRAAGAQAELGKTVDEEVADNARAGAGALRVRIIRPGQVVTQEVDPQRLNIEVDETGRIRRLRCG